MDYFLISSDNSILNPIEPIGLSKVLNKAVLSDPDALAELFEKMPHFYLKDKSHQEYPDFIDNSIPLVSDKLKELMSKFDPSVSFFSVMFVDARHMKQDIYWGMVPTILNCLSPKSEFKMDGSIKRLVIDRKKIEGSVRIFKIDGVVENHIIIDLCLAESLLRRDFNGIDLEKVDKEN